MEQLPTNRNFLELGNLQPGVQVVDGVALAPAKTGVSSVSIVGRSGHTTTRTLDGVDITDETTGATTQNIPVSGVQELQIFQSSVPPPSTLGAAGVVNVVTKSGGNDFHGQLFGNARDKGAGIAKFPGGQANPYSREVFGGNVGGPISKDKLFFFLGGEYFKRDLVAPVVFNAPFTALDGSYHSPFRDTELDGRLDYKLSTSARLFYRFSYDNLSSVDSFAGSNFQVFKTSAHAPTHTVGLDFGSGASTHSIRFGYMRFSNGVADAVDGSGIPNVAPGISLNFSGGSGFASGPSPLAPRRTIQENKEVRYDGTRIRQSHTFRYGFELNKIDDLVLANFYGLAPEVGLDTSAQSMLLAASQKHRLRARIQSNLWREAIKICQHQIVNLVQLETVSKSVRLPNPGAVVANFFIFLNCAPRRQRAWAAGKSRSAAKIQTDSRSNIGDPRTVHCVSNSI